MKRYLGVKIIQAKPMTRGDYNTFRGWTIPENENPLDEGYFIEYPDGYISWSPKKQFDEAYRETSAMTFGLAIEAMKKGSKVARTGWNGKGMWIAISPGCKGLDAKNVWNEHNRQAAIDNGGTIDIPPYVTMKSADNKIICGWLASQTDMLAEDWQIVE